jgi:hypothetical protein
MRLSLPSRFIAALLILCAAPLVGQTTGTWTGTYSLVESGCPGTFHGPAILYAIQTGSTFTAVLDIEMTFLEDCVPSTNRVMLPASGNVSGNSFSGIIVAPFGEEATVPFTGAIDGNTMTIVSDHEDTTVNMVLTRTSSAPPPAAVAGTYTGTYSVTDTMGYDPCANIPMITYSGPLTATMLQGGEAISGVVDLWDLKDTDHDPSGNCTIIDHPHERVLFTGIIAGDIISGALVAYDVTLPVTATVSGNTIAGAGGDTWRSITFSMIRTSAAPTRRCSTPRRYRSITASERSRSPAARSCSPLRRRRTR